MKNIIEIFAAQIKIAGDKISSAIKDTITILSPQTEKTLKANQKKGRGRGSEGSEGSNSNSNSITTTKGSSRRVPRGQEGLKWEGLKC